MEQTTIKCQVESNFTSKNHPKRHVKQTVIDENIKYIYIAHFALISAVSPIPNAGQPFVFYFYIPFGNMLLDAHMPSFLRKTSSRR